MELVFRPTPVACVPRWATSTPGDLGRRRGLERNAQVKTQKRQCGGAFGAVLRRSCSPSESPRSDVSCVYNVNTATGRWLLCRTLRLPTTWPCATPGACLRGLVPHPAPAYTALCLPTWPCAAPDACLHGLVPHAAPAYRYLGLPVPGRVQHAVPAYYNYLLLPRACLLGLLGLLELLGLVPLGVSLGDFAIQLFGQVIDLALHNRQFFVHHLLVLLVPERYRKRPDPHQD